MEGISDVQDCSPAEAADHVLYLLGTPVVHLAQWLCEGTHVLRKGAITSCQQLGSMQTWWWQLGNRVASPARFEKTFTVDRALAVLTEERRVEGSWLVLCKTHCYMALERAGKLDKRITVLCDGGGQRIADGNKRAVAFHEVRKQDAPGEDRIQLPVYLIVPS